MRLIDGTLDALPFSDPTERIIGRKVFNFHVKYWCARNFEEAGMIWWRWKQRGQSINKNEAALTEKGHVGTKRVKFPQSPGKLTRELLKDGIVRWFGGWNVGHFGNDTQCLVHRAAGLLEGLLISYQRNKNLKFSLWDAENRNQHNHGKRGLKFPSQINIDLLSKEKANWNKTKPPKYMKRFSTQKRTHFEESEQMFNPWTYEFIPKSRDF